MGPQESWIIPLVEATDCAEELVGGKAAKLAALLRRFHGSQRLLHHDQGLRAIRGGNRLGGVRCRGVRPQVVGPRTVGRTVGCCVTHPV